VASIKSAKPGESWESWRMIPTRGIAQKIPGKVGKSTVNGEGLVG